MIYSWERSWYPVQPALAERLPYIVVMVELLDSGNVRMVGNLLVDPGQDVPNERLDVGDCARGPRRHATSHTRSFSASARR